VGHNAYPSSTLGTGGVWNALNLLRLAGRSFLDLLYPPRCVGCGSHESWFCATCLASVELLRSPVCAKCGRPDSREGLCPSCSKEPLQIDAIRSVAYFAGPLREAIHHFKYRNLRALAYPLGELLVDYWRNSPLPADSLLAVPLHSRRERERGYNQAHLLAEVLGRSVGLPVFASGASGVLRRRRETWPQVELNGAERKANVAGAFHCESEQVAGRRIVLVDDVCTTGATLEACSAALQQAGAVAVWGLTLARAA
jgi:ComF family protein